MIMARRTATALSARVSLMLVGMLIGTTQVCAASFAPAAPLPVPRGGHTATLLQSGKVLVTGGDGAVVLATLLYDSAADAWGSVGSMAYARYGHGAVLLPSGKVLVAGGYNGTLTPTAFASAELYDPATATWSPAGSLGTGRGDFAAISLPDGKVLIAGGFDANYHVLASAEIYDPGSNTWSPTAPLSVGRVFPSATLLRSGKVLVAGGRVASSEIYDPASNTWGSIAPMTDSRFSHTATRLSSGKVLVAGGDVSVPTLHRVNTTEVYDPDANTWTASAPMINVRAYASAARLASGEVIEVGGLDDYELAQSEIYDPDANTWTPSASMAVGRFSHTLTTLPSGKLLAAGGDTPMDILASVEIYTPDITNFIYSSDFELAP